MKLGEVLAMARGISGKSLRDLERETGISNALLSQIETGHVKQPSFHSVVKIARVLNVRLDILAEHAVPDLRKVLRELREKQTKTPLNRAARRQEKRRALPQEK